MVQTRRPGEDGCMSSIWSVRRSVTDRKISGLAGGIARVWNVDPILVRVAFCVLALSGGIGVVLYVAGWLMVPPEDREHSVLDDAIPQTRGWPRELRIGIVVVLCVIGGASLSSVAPFGIAAAVVMAAVWYFGYYRNRPQRPDRPTHQQAETFRFAEFSGESTPFTEAATAWQQRMREYAESVHADADARAWAEHESSRRNVGPGPQYAYRDGTAAARAARSPGYQPDWTASAYPPDSHPSNAYASNAAAEAEHAAYLSHPDPVGLYSEPAPDASAIQLAAERKALRRRSARRLGLVSFVVLGLTISGLAVASNLGWITATVPVYLSAALLVVGLTLLAGARFGRPPGLAFLAVLLSLVTIASLFSGVRANLGDQQVGVRTASYTTLSELPASDHQQTGQLTVDLSKLDLSKLSPTKLDPTKLDPTRDVTYTATVDQGRLTVILPDTGAAKVDYRVQQGMVQLPDSQVQVGQDLTGDATVSDSGTTVSSSRTHSRGGSGDSSNSSNSSSNGSGRGGSTDEPTITLDLRVRQGQLEVRS